jgi:ferredoxin-NADP reductase
MKTLLEKPTFMRFKTKILDIKEIAPEVKHFVIEIPEKFRFIPGQYISWILPHPDGELRRSYSIASHVDNKQLELCIKIVKHGKGTPLIDACKAGDVIEIMGPLGHFVINEKSFNKDIVFVSTGTGVTPFRPMIDYLLKTGFQKKISLIAGYKTEKDVLYDDEFLALMKQYKNFSYSIVLSRSETHEKKYVQDVIKKIFSPDADYYICGLKEMVLGVRDLLLDKGVAREQIYFERYD